MHTAAEPEKTAAITSQRKIRAKAINLLLLRGFFFVFDTLLDGTGEKGRFRHKNSHIKVVQSIYMTTFDALLAPLSNALKNIGNLIDVETGSEILFFEDFVRSLLFGFSIQVPTFRQLIVELETNSDAIALGLIAFKRSTLKDGFVRFRAKYFEQLYQYALGQIESMPVGDKLLQNIGLLKVIDGSVFPHTRRRWAFVRGLLAAGWREHGVPCTPFYFL